MQAAKGEPGGFVSEQARERFMVAYDRAFTLWPRPWTEFDVETATTTTHIHRYGPADAEPVVLMHGAGFNGSTWYPNVAALGRDRPVFAIDTPGDPNRSVARAPIASPEASAAWPDARAEVVTGSRHGPSLEQADLVNVCITAFIAAASPDQARH